MSWRTIRRREAPMAIRIAISRSRTLARASIRFEGICRLKSTKLCTSIPLIPSNAASDTAPFTSDGQF